LAAATKSDSKVLNWAAGLHVRLSKLEEEGITRVWPAVKEDMLKLAAVPNLRTDTGLQLLKASGATEEHISMFRLASQVMSAGDGHTWYPHSEVVRKMGGNDKIVQKAIALGLLTQPRRGRLALSHIHDAEREIACMVAERMRGGGSVSACREEESDGNSSYNTGDALNPEQMSAVRTAISAPVCVWTGPPGSGKTTALSSLASRTSPNNILFLAPTGKAVVRLREVTQGAARPMTVHRWIHMRSEGGPGNEREREYHTVVVDESSMLDVLTFHALLSKLDEDAHLVLVGDTDQLPSVGPGCILRDLIDAGVPHVRLSTVYRQLQGSHLANAIEAMRADPMSIPASGPEGSDFWIEHITNRRAIATRLRELMHRYAAADGSGVLVATFRNQDVEEFGKTLRPLRRPQAWRMALAYGDRVMQTRNVYNGKDGSERLNGETGTVMDVVTDGFGDASSARFVHVQFDVDGRTEVYSDDLYGTQETYEELTMAVPITIHKAQGSQAETVIYIVPSENMFETKNLVYTAISRAQKRCIVLGSKAAFIVAINRPSLQRRTMLAEYVVDSTASATSSCAGRI
jgi:exodeoxyribonuclease V alpha subunit